jgi:hypothetical protein
MSDDIGFKTFYNVLYVLLCSIRAWIILELLLKIFSSCGCIIWIKIFVQYDQNKYIRFIARTYTRKQYLYNLNTRK